MRRVNTSLAVGWSILLIAACVQVSGCRNSPASHGSTPSAATAAADTTKRQDIVGTYTLVSINGNALPYTMTHEPPGVSVTSGTFTINADGTCNSMMVFVPPSGQTMSRQVGATWARNGSKLTMTWQGAGMTTGVIEGDMFTMDNEGQLLAYRKAR